MPRQPRLQMLRLRSTPSAWSMWKRCCHCSGKTSYLLVSRPLPMPMEPPYARLCKAWCRWQLNRKQEGPASPSSGIRASSLRRSESWLHCLIACTGFGGAAWQCVHTVVWVLGTAGVALCFLAAMLMGPTPADAADAQACLPASGARAMHACMHVSDTDHTSRGPAC